MPVHCNQWGVKDEVLVANGRLRYAQAVLDVFVKNQISSTYWIWRSYLPPGRLTQSMHSAQSMHSPCTVHAQRMHNACTVHVPPA